VHLAPQDRHRPAAEFRLEFPRRPRQFGLPELAAQIGNDRDQLERPPELRGDRGPVAARGAQFGRLANDGFQSLGDLRHDGSRF
jgi:hypothetical protein